MSYGMPYMGSKNSIAAKILAMLPSADVFVDIFAGGCAMTHAAMLSGRYKSFVINDLSHTPSLFLSAMCGEYATETRWITREVFHAEKDKDLYIRYVWSFGNNGKHYLYGEHVEEWKHALWNARVLGDMGMLRDMGIMSDGSMADVDRNEAEYKRKYIQWYYERLHSMPVPTDEQIAHTNALLNQSEEVLHGMLRHALEVHGVSQSQVCDFLGNQMGRHYFGKSQWAFPTPENYDRLRQLLPSLPILEGYHEYDTYKRLQRLQRLQSLQSLESLELESLESLERLQRLQRLQSLESLESLERLQRLQVKQYESDYRDVPLPSAHAVIYADPPYRGTAQYSDIIFDHDAFYDWCERQTLPLFISEYDMPRDRFKCVAEFGHVQRMNGKGATRNKERLFVPIHQRFCAPKQLSLF